ncbi:MAG: GNAT family N-acetyltransferase [Rhodocyclaceae bacterium]|nr:GNAT family N-acetyltransferase [Rhodocyclaceae bacterium]
MRERIAAALHPAVVVPGFDEIAHAETEQIVASVESAFRQAVSDPRQIVLVAEEDARACGFLIIDGCDGLAELRWIVMLPGHLGTGSAHRLMEAGLAEAGRGRPVSLVVTIYNERAIRFFRQFGFETVAGGASAGRVLRMRRPPVLRAVG